VIGAPKPREVRGGIVEIEIDAVADRADIGAGNARSRTEQLGFGGADEQAGIGAGGGGALEIEQPGGLAPVDPAHGAGPAIIGELGRIHVDEVHDEALLAAYGHELRHLAGESVDGAHLPASQHRLDEAAQAVAVEQGKRDRTA
jgi:hypothetical protein